MKHKKSLSLFVLLACMSFGLKAVNGHELWLMNRSTATVKVVCKKSSPTLDLAKQELINNWQGNDGSVIELKIVKDKSIKDDGFKIGATSIEATTPLGVLYGAFDLIRRQRTGEKTEGVLSNPSYQRRLLNHWDNPNGSIERGYAGNSFFWRGGNTQAEVTQADKTIWHEYARANASVGLNGAVLNNVNASPLVLSEGFLKRAAAIADVLRPYGVKVYLSINFSSPASLGQLKTSDPLDKEVIAWWQAKVKEIYQLIPDFGGFLVKASSEGQPGPQDFGRTHVDGANLLADALKPYNGIVMWRAFVYSPSDKDRAKQAYIEFKPFDGQFRDNVIIQVKNGPVDFQPREPFSPLFGAMKKTAVMPELQVTQEYLGHSYQMAFLSTMWEELLQTDTYQQGEGSTVARCTDGSLYKNKYTAIAGVANTGLDVNWCGYVLAQSNWYAFGRLAWDNSLTSEIIAKEWLTQTFYPAEKIKAGQFTPQDWTTQFLNPVSTMLVESREAVVDYMMPLGLHHIFSANEHYGPGPWYGPRGVRADWTPPYYHKADTLGIGFDRTKKGSDAVSQYMEPLASIYNNVETCPENLILWFHHLPWTYVMKSGRTLWDELCYKYQVGLLKTRDFQKTWDQVQSYIDDERFVEVQTKLQRQTREAIVWKDGCLLYFQQFSRLPFPEDFERPIYSLDYLKRVNMLNEYK